MWVIGLIWYASAIIVVGFFLAAAIQFGTWIEVIIMSAVMAGILSPIVVVIVGDRRKHQRNYFNTDCNACIRRLPHTGKGSGYRAFEQHEAQRADRQAHA